jgi:biotin operon repressor
MKQNKPLILTDYLSVGEENAITCKQLSKYLGLSERDITIQINALRKKGELICSNTQSGFWLPADDRDIEQFVRGMQGRIKDMQKAMKPAIEYLKNGGGDIDRE